ncbi:MAG: restriction endonuclease subunit S [Clostridia bacterium]|nr:restriction endonuclease subunit S [Clostridia bacterium]
MEGIPEGRKTFFRITPDANDLCVFAVKRGDIENRIDINHVLYKLSITGTNLKTNPLGELCLEEPCYGTSASAIERTDDKQPKYIRITDFDDFGIEENHKYMTAETYLDKHLLKKNDILFARSGSVGRTYFYDGSIGSAVFAGYCIRFRFDEKKVIPKYAYWCTKINFYQKWVKGIQRSAVQSNINKEEYKSFEIVLPPLDIQQKLVDFMDDASASMQSKIYKSENLLSSLSKYVLERLGLSFDFPDKKIIYATKYADIHSRIDADYYSPEFAHFRMQIEKSAYEVLTVEAISEKIVSGFAAGKEDQADNLPNSQRVPHLRPFSITPDGELTFNTKKYVPKSRLSNKDYCKRNEVIFNNTNSPELVGKTTVLDADIPCAASNHITRITVKEGINPYYVAAFFNVLLSIGYWKLLCTNFNNQAGVNTDTLKNVKIPVPDITVQQEIADEIQKRRLKARQLKIEAEQEWQAAKDQFEKDLLGE